MDRQTNGWMDDGWVDGWMDGWVDKQMMDGWEDYGMKLSHHSEPLSPPLKNGTLLPTP